MNELYNHTTTITTKIDVGWGFQGTHRTYINQTHKPVFIDRIADISDGMCQVKQVSFKLSFEGGKGRSISDGQGKGIPNCGCLKAESSLAVGFGVNFGDSKEFLRARSKGACGMVDGEK